MTKKKFDCVEMKHKGAEAIAEEISGLTPAGELDYWKSRNQELINRKSKFKTKPGKQNRL